MKAQPTEIVIWDLDDVLYVSQPVPAENPSWWFSAQSLSEHGSPGFDPRWNLQAVVLARRGVSTAGVRTALLTGRPQHREMEQVFRRMLGSADLHFDHLQLKPVTLELPTPDYKAAVVRK